MSTPPVTAASLDELLRRVAEAVRDRCKSEAAVSDPIHPSRRIADLDLAAIIARVKKE